MKFIKWLLGLFKNGTQKTEVSTVPPVINPEVPTKEEIDNFPGIKLDPHRVQEIKDVCSKFYKNQERYRVVSAACGVPEKLIFALHYRESSLNFLGVLHNGERILNTGRKTSLVPKGRGPFITWEEAAIDALLLKKSIFPKDWNFKSMCDLAEKFNGMGYARRGELSPYVWAGTERHDETGKYVADGKYSSTAIEKQLGVAAILIELGVN